MRPSAENLDLCPRDLNFFEGLLQQAIKEEAVNSIWELSGHPPSARLPVTEEAEALQQTVDHNNNSSSGVDTDTEVAELHKKVLAAQERVDSLRQQVPDELSTAVAKEMEALRPVLEKIPIHQTDEVKSPSDQAPSYAGAVNELSVMLSAAMDRVPGLKARLDQTVQRLSRVIDTFESEKSRPSPKTVERVLMNRSPACGGMPTPGDATASAARTNMTRRQLAHDLALHQAAM
eukprot:gene13673-19561_t